jgi:protein TonB
LAEHPQLFQRPVVTPRPDHDAKALASAGAASREQVMTVTDILRDRMTEPAGLQTMLTASVVVHALGFGVLLFAPGGWLSRGAASPPTVMTITLGGGGTGPANGGMTAMGGRPVQAVAPVETKRPEPVRPPAPKAPEMTVPVPKALAAPRKQPPEVKAAPEESRGRTPTRGAEVAPGSAVAETGARGQGFGLSSGGGPGAGSTLDVADFCCPDYLVLMTERIRSAWNQNQGVSGQAVVKFTIQRDGRLTDAAVERGSGYPILDIAALRAVLTTAQLPPLPGAFPNPSLTVHLNFEYQR